MKTLKVVKEILERLKVTTAKSEDGASGSIKNRMTFASACFLRTSHEEKDTIEEVFQRRMACRNYFKDLRLQLVKVHNAQHGSNEKLEKTPAKKKKDGATAKKEKSEKSTAAKSQAPAPSGKKAAEPKSAS